VLLVAIALRLPAWFHKKKSLSVCLPHGFVAVFFAGDGNLTTDYQLQTPVFLFFC
jgi:hypothetical protein